VFSDITNYCHITNHTIDSSTFFYFFIFLFFIFYFLPLLVEVGERTGKWWREEGPIKMRKKNKKKMNNEVDFTKMLIENETADVLVTIPMAQLRAKEVREGVCCCCMCCAC
jgi:hypothetical protein